MYQKSTYGRIVLDYLPQKEYPYQKGLTVGGNLMNYPGDVGTTTSDMITSKLLFNSILLNIYTKLMVIEKNYLNTPMAGYEYMRLPIDIIMQEIVYEYQLMDK